MTSIFNIDHLRFKFYALSAREQLLVIGVTGAFLYLCLDNFFINPQTNQHTQLLASFDLSQSEILAVQVELSSVDKFRDSLRDAQDVNRTLKNQMSVLKAVKESIQIENPHIVDLIQKLTQPFPHVTLVSLKTQAPKVLPLSQKNIKGISKAGNFLDKPIYKYTIDIEIRGKYLDLLKYVQNIESNLNHLFWSDAKLASSNFPESTLTLSILVLSEQSNLKLSML